jgi:hypothetical protein
MMVDIRVLGALTGTSILAGATNAVMASKSSILLQISTDVQEKLERRSRS